MSKPSLDDLKKVSAESGIPLSDLQAEFDVYEYSFSSCKEASEKYTYGYNSYLSSQKEFDESAIAIAYRKAWQEISLKEQHDVTTLTFEESLSFLQICYPEGEQLLKLLDTIEKHVGVDFEKVRTYLKSGRRPTFYSYKDCPINALTQRIMDRVDEAFKNKAKEVNTIESLKEVMEESTSYGFGDYRPFPTLYAFVRTKMIGVAKTLDELASIGAGDGKDYLNRWEKLCRNKTMTEILPTLKTFLSVIREKDQRSYETCNKVYHKVCELFHKCNTVSEAGRLYEIGKVYCNDEAKNLISSRYCWRCESILKKKYPHPKLPQFRTLLNDIPHGSDRYRKDMEELWIEKSKVALLGPIPSFRELYNMVHKSMQDEVLNAWNKWGITQMEGLVTWNDLTRFDLTLIPVPQERYNNKSNMIWSNKRGSFWALTALINKLTDAAESKENLFAILQFIDRCHAAFREMHEFGTLYPEQEKIVEKYIKHYQSGAELGLLFDKFKEYIKYDMYVRIFELIFDAMLQNQSGTITQILADVKDGSKKLYSKYLRLKVQNVLAT